MYEALETVTPRFFQVGEVGPSWETIEDEREETQRIEWRIASIVRGTGEFKINVQQVRRYKDGDDIKEETVSGRRMWAEVPVDMIATLFRSG